MSFPKVTILGTGNLANHLSKALEQSGIQLEYVYGRSLDKAKKIANNLYATKATDRLDFSQADAQIYILCVTDNAIAHLAREVILPEKAIILHTSGATALDVIEQADTDYGVFYPLQTFSKTRKISFDKLPICLEASSDEAEILLESLVKKLGAVPCFMNSEQRLSTHLAAVFACNFSNHFYSIAQAILKEKGLPLELLQPLILETTQKALEIGPENAQTGPAIRQDLATMFRHQELLKEHPNWQELYSKISENIAKGN
jgi:predicted short-subunit dehydrogenase-like oxidoreductase (DUF2520 family)